MSADSTELRSRRWIARDLITLGVRWLSDIDEICVEWGMNYADQMVLATLILDRGGRCRPKDLELPSHLAASTLTKSMKRLETRGYVSRETDPDDRRALWLVATQEGRTALDEILPRLNELVERSFGELTRDDESHLRALLDELLRVDPDT